MTYPKLAMIHKKNVAKFGYNLNMKSKTFQTALFNFFATCIQIWRFKKKKKSGRILAIEHLIKHLILALFNLYIYPFFALYSQPKKEEERGCDSRSKDQERVKEVTGYYLLTTY